MEFTAYINCIMMSLDIYCKILLIDSKHVILDEKDRRNLNERGFVKSPSLQISPFDIRKKYAAYLGTYLRMKSTM